MNAPGGDQGSILSNAVHDRLREGLMRAELVPHQRLKVRDLAREMGTSETPVREALIQLARDGPVEIRPRHYIRVRRLSHDDHGQIRDMRLLLEPMAAERAAAADHPGRDRRPGGDSRRTDRSRGGRGLAGRPPDQFRLPLSTGPRARGS